MLSTVKNHSTITNVPTTGGLPVKGEHLSDELVDPELNACPPESTAQSQPSKEWEAAQERVLFYLKILNIPVQERLELALEALRRATKDEVKSGIIPAAMRAIKALLQERYPTPLTFHPASFIHGDIQWNDLRSVPVLNRGVMTHSAFDRTTIVTILAFLLGRLLKATGRLFRFMITPAFLFVILFVLLSLLFILEVQ